MTSNLYVISSSEGIVLSSKPFIKVESIIVSRDQVIGYGSRDEVEKIGSRLDAELIDLDKLVLPGFVDAHLHIDSLGFELSTINLLDVKSREELLERLSGLKPNIDEWIVVGRFDHLVFPDQRPPTRSELDAVIPDRPVLLIHRSGHMGVVNTRALEKVRDLIRESEADVERGWVYESTLWSIRRRIHDLISEDERAEMIVRADQHLWSYGVTAVGVAGATRDLLKQLIRLDRENKLYTRIYVYMYVEKPEDLKNIWVDYVETRVLRGRVRVNGVKVLMDGALGPRTAYLSQPYRDDPGNKGVLLHSREWLEEIIYIATTYGLQVAVHAIGDAALDTVLEAYGKVKEMIPVLRHRIEHASLVRDDQVQALKNLRPVLVVQPHFIITDKWVINRVGVDRVNWVYRFKTLYESTILGFSTDAPVEPVNPWETVYAAVTRGVGEGLRHGILTTKESMDLLDALHAYTRGSAYALRDDKLGCLLPGCYPDMIVVDKNPFDLRDPSELLEIRSKPLNPWMRK